MLVSTGADGAVYEYFATCANTPGGCRIQKFGAHVRYGLFPIWRSLAFVWVVVFCHVLLLLWLELSLCSFLLICFKHFSHHADLIPLLACFGLLSCLALVNRCADFLG